MAERARKAPDTNKNAVIPRCLSAEEVEQLVKDVIRMSVEEAERRRRLGIADPEALGLSPEARGLRFRSAELTSIGS